MKLILIIVCVSIGLWVFPTISEGASPQTPVLVLLERSHDGHRRVIFALYDTGDIIFQHSYSSYAHIRLDSREFQHLLNELSVEELSALDTLYYLPSETVLGETLQEFYLSFDGVPKHIRVYGDLKKPPVSPGVERMYEMLREECPSPTNPDNTVDSSLVKRLRTAIADAQNQTPLTPVTVCGMELELSTIRSAITGGIGSLETYETYRVRCPKRIVNVFETLISYTHPHAKPWLPEKIEVILHKMNTDFQAPQWPVGWPDLHAPDTQKAREETYRLFLNSDQLEALKRLLETGKSLVTMNATTWFVSWRFPFPGEEAWQHGWAPVKFPSGNT